jgi:hypothetical protein
MSYTILESGKYQCDECGWEGSRSGFYKHRKIHQSTEETDVPEAGGDTSFIPVEEEIVEVEVEDSPSWMDFETVSSGDSTPSQMPTPLKALHRKAAAKKGKRTKKEIESLRETSKSITMLGLTFGDSALSVWGRGVLLDPDFKIERNDRDKEITADAVVGAMEERGVYLAENISRQAVATIMLGWYFGVPTYKIQKNAKRGLFKGGRGSGLLSRIPLIGRIFRRKRKNPPIPQTVEVVQSGE